MLLVEDIYGLTRQFPLEERYGLSSQTRRAAVSIPSNIAEGRRRGRNKPYANHLEIALGSQAEVEVQVELALRLHYCSRDVYERINRRVEGVGRMLNGLLASLKTHRDR